MIKRNSYLIKRCLGECLIILLVIILELAIWEFIEYLVGPSDKLYNLYMMAICTLNLSLYFFVIKSSDNK